MSSIGERTAVLDRTDKICRDIASHSDILFRLTQDDPADNICTNLRLAAAALRTDDIPARSGSARLYIHAGAERVKAVSAEIELFRSELPDDLTELYKLKELLTTVSGLDRDNMSILESCEMCLNTFMEEDIPRTERSLVSHSLRDITLSQTIAQKNISLTESWIIKTDNLIAGLTSFEEHMIPLWRTQFRSLNSFTDDDMTRCFETGNLFSQKLSELIG